MALCRNDNQVHIINQKYESHANIAKSRKNIRGKM